MTCILFWRSYKEQRENILTFLNRIKLILSYTDHIGPLDPFVNLPLRESKFSFVLRPSALCHPTYHFSTLCNPFLNMLSKTQIKGHGITLPSRGGCSVVK